MNIYQFKVPFSGAFFIRLWGEDVQDAKQFLDEEVLNERRGIEIRDGDGDLIEIYSLQFDWEGKEWTIVEKDVGG